MKMISVCPHWYNWPLCVVCSDRVQSLCYLQLTRQLVSCSSDGGIAVWNMDVSREEVREQGEADLQRSPGNWLLGFPCCCLEAPTGCRQSQLLICVLAGYCKAKFCLSLCTASSTHLRDCPVKEVPRDWALRLILSLGKLPERTLETISSIAGEWIAWRPRSIPVSGNTERSSRNSTRDIARCLTSSDLLGP